MLRRRIEIARRLTTASSAVIALFYLVSNGQSKLLNFILFPNFSDVNSSLLINFHYILFSLLFYLMPKVVDIFWDSKKGQFREILKTSLSKKGSSIPITFLYQIFKIFKIYKIGNFSKDFYIKKLHCLDWSTWYWFFLNLFVEKCKITITV